MNTYCVRRRGFTLQEAAVVLVTLAILATIAVPSFITFINGTKESTAEVSAKNYVNQARALVALREDDEPGSTLQSSPEDWVTAGQDMPEGSYIEGVPTPLPTDAIVDDLNGADSGTPELPVTGGEISGPIEFGHTIDTDYFPVEMIVVGNDVTFSTDQGQPGPPPLTTAPSAPQAVTAARASSTSLSVSFTAPASDGGAAVSGYSAICVSTDGGAPGSAAFTSSPITVASLTTGKTYVCEVTAANSAGTSPASAPSDPVELIDVADAPTGLSVSVAGSTSLTLDWNPVSSTTAKPVTGYAVYQLNSVTELYELVSLVPGASSDTYTITGLTAGTTYSFTVATYNGAGEGLRSEPASGMPITTPNATTISGTSFGDQTITVDWTASATAAAPITAFRIYKDGTEVTTVGSAIRTYTFTGLTAGTEYTLAVKPYNSQGTTTAVDGSDTTTATAITALEQLTWADPATSVTSTSVTMNWNALTSTAAKPVTGYAVYQLNTVSELYELVSLVPGAASGTYTVTGLTAGTAYSFQVVAYNTLGEGVRSEATSATPITLAAAVTITDTTLGNQQVTIDWTASATAAAPITGFRIYRNGTELTTVGSAIRTYTFTGLTAGTEYTLAVKPYNSQGTTTAGDGSDTTTETAITTLDQVTWASPATTVTSTSVTVNWNTLSSTAAKPVTGYAVYQLNTATGIYTLVSLVPGASSSSYEVTGLSAGTSYSFKVAAYNTLGEGVRSEVTSATPISAPIAPAVTSVSVASTSSLQVTWTSTETAGQPVDDYTVTCTSSDGGATGTVTGAISPTTVGSLTSGKSYTCTVTATNDAGVTSSSVSASTQVPSALALSYASTQFTTGSNSQTLSPTVTGGFGSKSYSVAGTLPEGVTFNSGTGTFTGPASAAWKFKAVQVSEGYGHTCAVTGTGGVKCWGDNSAGQLGDGTQTQRLTPVDVSGLTSGVVSVDAGGGHTCAVTTGGAAKCWGAGGRLGNGTTSASPTPVDVSGLTSGVATISAGDTHTCVVTVGGGVKCWGDNGWGQLGDGTQTQRLTPVDVSGLTSGSSSVSAGRNYTCAVTVAGGAKCWGDGYYGNLGNGKDSSTPVLTPDAVLATGQTAGGTALAGVALISTTEYYTSNAGGSSNAYITCAVMTSGAAKCWGFNGPWHSPGWLGVGSTASHLTVPANVSGLSSGVAQISAGNHTCARMSVGSLKCWGDNWQGPLGTGDQTYRSAPTDVVGLSGVVSVSTSGDLRTCAVLDTGVTKCWGRSATGRLGNGLAVQSNVPVNVSNTGPHPGFPANVDVSVADESGTDTTSVTLTMS